MVSRGAIGIVGGETLLGKDVESREQPQGFIAIEIINVAEPFFIQQL